MKPALTAFIFLACCVFASIANGQRSAITQDEYETMIDSAVTVGEKRIRRITTVIETRTKEGRITGTSQHVEEYIPPELERFVDTFTSGDLSTTEEIVQVGRSGFQKKDRAPWVEWTGSPYRGLVVRRLNRSYGLCGGNGANRCSHTSQQAMLAGQVVQMLSRIGEEEGQRRESLKVWMSRDGMLLRSELVESEGSSSDWTRRTIGTWEYDPAGLKIEAPIK